MNNEKFFAALYALIAAVFYAVGVPCSKLLLENVQPVFMAALMYLGAGLGVGIMYSFHYKSESPSERLSMDNIIYVVECFTAWKF